MYEAYKGKFEYTLLLEVLTKAAYQGIQLHVIHINSRAQTKKIEEYLSNANLIYCHQYLPNQEENFKCQMYAKNRYTGY